MSIGLQEAGRLYREAVFAANKARLADNACRAYGQPRPFLVEQEEKHAVSAAILSAEANEQIALSALKLAALMDLR